ncbi:MAG: AraC family transcriptional regulator [Lachnospiraceae bacterium]
MKLITDYNNPDLLTGSYYTNIDAYYHTTWKNFLTKEHAHRHMELMYVCKGSCFIELKEEKRCMKTGDFIILNSSTFHKLIVNDTSCNMINLEFHFSDECPIENLIPFGTLIRCSETIHCLLSADKDYLFFKDPDNLRQHLSAIIFQQALHTDLFLRNQLFISELFLRISSLMTNSRCYKQDGPIIYVHQALAYIQENYDTDITIQSISNHTNIHKTYLQKLFRQHIDCTLIEYLTVYRLEKSKILLTDTDLMISDIPSYIGLNSVQYYINLFKKYCSCTPLQYRKQFSITHRNSDYDTHLMY